MAIIDYPQDLSAAQEAVVDEIRANRGGRLPDLFRIMLHSPEVARGWLGLGTAVRYHTSLDDAVRETLICYVAKARNCRYEYANHAPIAEAAGVPPEALTQLQDWRAASLLTQDQRVALAVAEAAAEAAAPDGADLRAALGRYGEQGVLEIFALVSYYTAVALFLNGLAVDEARTR